LEAAWSWPDYLEPLRLARSAFGWEHRDDRDAVQLEIGLNTQHLTDTTVIRDHRSRDHSAWLKGARGAPGPGAIFPGGGELDIHTTRHCGGEATC